MLSYWEKAHFTHYDALFIGGGITGLNAAIEFKKQRPNSDVAVLERGIFPSGASTKNAGFACFGSVTELLDDLSHMPEEEVLHLVKKRYEGLQRMRGLLGEREIGYVPCGGYELITAQESYALKEVNRLNALLHPLFGQDVYRENKNWVSDFALKQEAVESVILNQFEGKVNTGKLMRRLIALAQAEGVMLLTGAEVSAVQEEENSVLLTVKTGAGGVFFKTPRLGVCTNGFAQKLFPDAGIKPGRGQVLITEPIPDLKLRGTFHYDRGYFYFRDHEERLVLGGGRQLDYEGETTTEFALTTQITEALDHLLQGVLLPGRKVKIAHRWAGIMGFGNNKKYILKQDSPHVWWGFGLNGMGVALGNILGAELAEKMVNH